MTLSPYLTIRTPLFNSFLISIAGTRTFNSPLNLNWTKRFLFLMFSSNAILRATCCKDNLYLCKIEKNRFSENLSGRRFLLTCFKTVTLRLFGFLFSSPDRLLYFARERAKLGPEIALFARAGKPKYCAWLEKLTHIIKI